MSWIDNSVVVIIVAVSLLIMYRALKEPIDLLLSLIGRAFGGIRDRLFGAGEAVVGDTIISYG